MFFEASGGLFRRVSSPAQRRSRRAARPPTGRARPRRAGVTSENVAERFGVSRAQQDAHAARSHQRAAAAQAAGFFDSQIVPVDTVWKDPKTGEEKQVHVDKDDGVRPGATAKALGALKPVFKRNGTTTAGNSSQARAPSARPVLLRRKRWLAGPVSCSCAREACACAREACASLGWAHCDCAQDGAGLHSTMFDGYSALVAVGRRRCACAFPPAPRRGRRGAHARAQVSDGAGAVLLMTRAEAAKRSLPILGIFRSFAAVGVDPAVMGVGPAVAIPAAVAMAGLTLDDIDLIELNEAFSSQVRALRVQHPSRRGA